MPRLVAVNGVIRSEKVTCTWLKPSVCTATRLGALLSAFTVNVATLLVAL